MTVITLSGTSAGIALTAGDVLDVQSGGLAISTTIGFGADAYVAGGTSATMVDGGGVEFESPFGSAYATTVQSGGAQIVSSGATVIATALNSGGFLIALPGSVEESTMSDGGSTVSTGVVLFQPDAGVSVLGDIASGQAVGGGAINYVLPGGETSSTTVSSGGTELVLTGGYARATTVSSGGASTVAGAAFGATVAGTGAQFVAANGNTVGTTVQSGGAELVSSGGVASGTELDNGGYLVVLPGGGVVTPVFSGGTIVSTGIAFYQAGSGIAIEGPETSGLVVSGGGTEYVLSGGGASSTTVSSGGSELVFGGGSAVSDTISGGGSGAVFSGGQTRFETVSAGGIAIVSGGQAISASLDTSGTMGVFAGGATTATSVGFEALEQVNAGGTTTGSMIGNFGDEEILGGTASDTTVSSGGFAYVYGGGGAVGATVEDTALLAVFSGTTTGATVSTGGQEGVSSGTAISTTVTGIDATLLLYLHGTASDTVVEDGGDEYVHGGSAVSTTVSNGGTETVQYNSTELGIVLSSGGTAVLNDGAVASGGVVFDGTATRLEIDGTTMPSAVISSFGLNMTIDLANESYASDWQAVPVTGDRLEVTNIGSGGPLFLQLDHDYSDATFLASPDAGSGTDITLTSLPNATGGPCYRAGTRIRTDRGDIEVEHLRPGDRVISVFGRTVAITWLGHRRVDCRRHPRPQDVWPIRVAAGAFTPGQPSRDLFLSPDHAVHIAGVLLPIRYLVNSATIAQVPADDVTYWHVELPRHDVLLAENLPCESYLDTGNRGAFDNAAGAIMLHPDFARQVWETEACARIVTDGAERAAIHGRLLARAEQLGHAVTFDPDLRVLVDGSELRPIIAGQIHRFELPPGASSIRLISRSAVPAHLWPDERDERRLGAAIGGITLDGIRIALTDKRLGAGWHNIECDGWRWTDGDATIHIAGSRHLEIEVVMTGRYLAAA